MRHLFGGGVRYWELGQVETMADLAVTGVALLEKQEAWRGLADVCTVPW